MKEAVIVSTARTGIGRAYRARLNATRSPTLPGHAIAPAVQRAGVALAQEQGRFDQEIVPSSTRMAVVDEATREVTYEDITLAKGEGNRPDTTLEELSSLKPAMRGVKHVVAALCIGGGMGAAALFEVA